MNNCAPTSPVSIIPNSRALLDMQGNRFVTVLQACIDGRWQSVSILSSTASEDRDQAEQLGRVEAAELGVPWFAGARIEPHFCRCCGEESSTGKDCCTDDFPEPADVREWQ